MGDSRGHLEIAGLHARAVLVCLSSCFVMLSSCLAIGLDVHSSGQMPGGVGLGISSGKQGCKVGHGWFLTLGRSMRCGERVAGKVPQLEEDSRDSWVGTAARLLRCDSLLYMACSR